MQRFPKERCSSHVRTLVSSQRLALIHLIDPRGFSVCPNHQLILCFYTKPKKLQQGLLHGHCQDWGIVQHSVPSTWESKRTRHLASYTDSWGLEQRRRGIGSLWVLERCRLLLWSSKLSHNPPERKLWEPLI